MVHGRLFKGGDSVGSFRILVNSQWSIVNGGWSGGVRFQLLFLVSSKDLTVRNNVDSRLKRLKEYKKIINQNNGLWTMDYGLWTKVNEPKKRAVDYGLTSINQNNRLWTMDYGPWTFIQ